MGTNITPSELNYDHYTAQQYDRDIIRVIPFHRELHERIGIFLKSHVDAANVQDILDLGTGTGITAQLIHHLLPKAKIDVVDFSAQMITGAKKKLGKKNISYLLGDYTKMTFDKKYDIVSSVIGMHHQNTSGKKKIFKKISSLINNGGYFIFGDLVTYKNAHEAAKNTALHYHHLVEYATDETALTEWAYHHMYLNDLAPIEDQMDWLKDAGFTVKKDFLQMNTALLLCRKTAH